MSSSLQIGLHKSQLEIFNNPAAIKVVTAGRAYGKSVLGLATALTFAITYQGKIDPKTPKVVVCAMPTLKMARSIIWKPLVSLVENLSITKSIDRSDFRIIFKNPNTPDILVRGADKQAERLRGLNMVFFLGDEIQGFNLSSWDAVIQPALARNADHKALLIGTPQGKINWLYKLSEDAKRFDNYAYFHRTTLDNPFISKELVERMREQLPPKLFRQEMEASFEDFEGVIFSEIDDRHKVKDIPSNFRTIFLGADWGDINCQLSVVGITNEKQYYILDNWRSESKIPVPEAVLMKEAERLCNTYGIYRSMLPDDRTASILSFRLHGKANNVSGMQRAVQVVRSKPGPFERAIIANSLFYQDRLFFAPKVHHLYDEFASYRFEKDSNGNLQSKPAKGQDDHFIDASLYIIGQLEHKFGSVKPIEDNRPLKELILTA